MWKKKMQKNEKKHLSNISENEKKEKCTGQFLYWIHPSETELWCRAVYRSFVEWHEHVFTLLFIHVVRQSSFLHKVPFFLFCFFFHFIFRWKTENFLSLDDEVEGISKIQYKVKWKTSDRKHILSGNEALCSH